MRPPFFVLDEDLFSAARLGGRCGIGGWFRGGSLCRLLRQLLGGGRQGLRGSGIGLTAGVLRRAGFPGRGRGRPAHADFLLEENFSEAETPAGQFAGIVVGEQFDPFFADFGEINVPCLFAKVLHGHPGAVFGLAALLFLLTAAIFLLAALLFLLAALLFLLAAEVFLFTPLLILLAALLGSESLGLRVARRLVLALLISGGLRRGRGGAGRVICGVRRRFRGGGGLSGELVLLCHHCLSDVLNDLRGGVAGFFGIGFHIG